MRPTACSSRVSLSSSTIPNDLPLVVSCSTNASTASARRTASALLDPVPGREIRQHLIEAVRHLHGHTAHGDTSPIEHPGERLSNMLQERRRDRQTPSSACLRCLPSSAARLVRPAASSSPPRAHLTPRRRETPFRELDGAPRQCSMRSRTCGAGRTPAPPFKQEVKHD